MVYTISESEPEVNLLVAVSLLQRMNGNRLSEGKKNQWFQVTGWLCGGTENGGTIVHLKNK